MYHRLLWLFELHAATKQLSWATVVLNWASELVHDDELLPSVDHLLTFLACYAMHFINRVTD